MSVRFDHRNAGTPEAAWDAHPLPSEPLELDVAHLLVVAAHPDDETLGAGGLLATAAAGGVDVTVVIVTDGEAADTDDADLSLRRRAESARALARLAPRARLRFLGLPDGGLREHADELAALLTGELAGLEPDDTLVATTWRGDGHRDHRVLGETVRAVAADFRIVGFPIWYWHWGDPARPDAGPWLRLALCPAAREAKATAIAEHVSQLRPADGSAPIIHEGMRAHFDRADELFVAEARASDAPSVQAEVFEDFFRRHDDPWGFETRWYEERKRALVLASLPRRRFGRAVELGCATGVLTAALTERCDEVLGIDASAEALRRARPRASDARFAQAMLPEDWPEGPWDLVVLSEVGYYLSRRDMAETARRIAEDLSEDGILVACHWRHVDDDAPLDADAVHAAIARTGLRRMVRHLEDDVILEVWARPGTPSVAEAEGLR